MKRKYEFTATEEQYNNLVELLKQGDNDLPKEITEVAEKLHSKQHQRMMARRSMISK